MPKRWQKMSPRLNSSLNADEVLDSIIESIGEIVPFDVAAVLMIKGRKASIVRSKGYRERGLEKWIAETQLNLDEIKDFREITRTKKPKVTPNTEKSKDWQVIAETALIKSHITSPINCRWQRDRISEPGQRHA